MPYNDSAVQDPQGEYDDWIEIYNISDSDVNMQGKALTNQCTDADKWVFPDTILAAGGHLVVWCDNDVSDPGLHANFTLAESGDTLVLYDNLASCYLQIDRVIYPSTHRDASYGRLCDGMSRWVEFMPSTPGSANSGCADTVQNLRVVVEDNSLHLFWHPYYWATGYTIYRNSTYPFDPVLGDSIAVTSDTSYVDIEILPVLPSAFYRVRARID
jgi:hypothetical protein